jgi:ParB family chromosome partitioning protein
MIFCYLPTSEVGPNPNNPFPPLEGEDYEDLKESIRKHGILEQLIVVRKDHGKYKYIALVGNNRLRIARELNLKEIPCFIDDSITLEAAIDINICGNQFTPAEIKKYKDLKEKIAKEEKDKYLQEKLIPEVYDKFRQGLVPEGIARMLAKHGREEQTTFFNSLKVEVLVDPDEEVQEKLKKELQQTKEQVQKLKETLQTREASLEELRKRENKAREVLEEKLNELEKAKLNADKVVRKEYEKEIQGLHKNLKELSLQIKEKNKEIDKTKEDKERAERIIKDKEAEVKAVLIKERDNRENLKKIIEITSAPQSILKRLDFIISELDIMSDHVTQFTWDKDTVAEVERKTEEIITKVKKVAKDMRENVAAEIKDVQMSNKL